MVDRDEMNVVCDNKQEIVLNETNDESPVSRSDPRMKNVSIGVRKTSPRKKPSSRRSSVGGNASTSELAQSQGNSSSGSLDSDEKESSALSKRRTHRRKSAVGIVSNDRSSSFRDFNTSASSGSEESIVEQKRPEEKYSSRNSKSKSSSRRTHESKSSRDVTIEWRRETTKVSDERHNKSDRRKVRDQRRTRSENDVFEELQLQTKEAMNTFEPFDISNHNKDESLNLNDIPFFDEDKKVSSFSKSDGSSADFEKKARRAPTGANKSFAGESMFNLEKKYSKNGDLNDPRNFHKSYDIGSTYASPTKSRSSKRAITSRTKMEVTPPKHKDTSPTRNKATSPMRNKALSPIRNNSTTSSPTTKKSMSPIRNKVSSLARQRLDENEELEQSIGDFFVDNKFLFSPEKKKVINNFHESVVPVDISDFENSFSASEFGDEPGFLQGDNSRSFQTRKITPELLSPATGPGNNDDCSGPLDFNAGFDEKVWEPADNEFSFAVNSPVKAYSKSQKDKKMKASLSGTGDDGFGSLGNLLPTGQDHESGRQQENDNDTVLNSPEKGRKGPRHSKNDPRKHMLAKQQQSTSTLSSTSSATTNLSATSSLLSSDSPVRLASKPATKENKPPNRRSSMHGDVGEQDRKRAPTRSKSEDINGDVEEREMHRSPTRSKSGALETNFPTKTKESKPSRRSSAHGDVGEKDRRRAPTGSRNEVMNGTAVERERYRSPTRSKSKELETESPATSAAKQKTNENKPSRRSSVHGDVVEQDRRRPPRRSKSEITNENIVERERLQSPTRSRSDELDNEKMYASPRRKHDAEYLRRKTASRAEESKFFSPPTRRKSIDAPETPDSEGSRRKSISGIMEERNRVSQQRRKSNDGERPS